MDRMHDLKINQESIKCCMNILREKEKKNCPMFFFFLPTVGGVLKWNLSEK